MNEIQKHEWKVEPISIWLDPVIAELIKNLSWPTKEQYIKRDAAIRFLRWTWETLDETVSIEYFDALIACNMPSAAWNLVNKLPEYHKLKEHATSLTDKLRWLGKLWFIWELIEISS